MLGGRCCSGGDGVAEAAVEARVCPARDLAG